MQYISTLQTILMLVGTVVGAGFASGREIWVYFGSFGAWGYVGLLAFIVGYVLTCIAGFKLSNKLGRNDFEAVIVPEGHKGLSKFVKTYMILVLWAVLICMTAAAGSVANQQFGIPKFIEGLDEENAAIHALVRSDIEEKAHQFATLLQQGAIKEDVPTLFMGMKEA